MSNKELQKELDKINQDIQKLNNNLIAGLQTAGIEFIDLYRYIDLLDILTVRKNKIQYLIATDI